MLMALMLWLLISLSTYESELVVIRGPVALLLVCNTLHICFPRVLHIVLMYCICMEMTIKVFNMYFLQIVCT